MKKNTGGGEQQRERFIAARFVEGRITLFYDPAAMLFLERRDLTLSPQHGPVFIFTAASTTPLQPPLLWLHAVCCVCVCVSERRLYCVILMVSTDRRPGDGFIQRVSLGQHAGQNPQQAL